MIYQAIGICCIAAAWAVFAWRYELCTQVAIIVAHWRRARIRAARLRCRAVSRFLSGQGTYGQPWGGK